jgi:exportin-5
MNGSANGFSALPGKSDNFESTNGSETNLLSRIHGALELVHGPYSSNESRKEASLFLEEIKANEEAPYHGFTLADDRSQQAVVRHYALSLLEHAVKRQWQDYSNDQRETLRGWILRLSENLSSEDPSYLRNKTAQLWVEVAKRSWGSEWSNMDELLVQLWSVPGSVVHKEFVLLVLETLSDEVFSGDDAAAVLREATLKKALVEIFTSAETLATAFPDRQIDNDVRFGEDGWLIRLGEFLNECLDNDLLNNEQYRICAVKTLAVFKSVTPWATSYAIAAASCVKHMCRSLTTSSVPVQMVRYIFSIKNSRAKDFQASIEALHALYSRTHLTDEEFLSLVCPMYRRETVNLLRKVYEWCIVDPRDIDDEKYLLAKKFSEVRNYMISFPKYRWLITADDVKLRAFLRPKNLRNT